MKRLFLCLVAVFAFHQLARAEELKQGVNQPLLIANLPGPFNMEFERICGPKSVTPSAFELFKLPEENLVWMAKPEGQPSNPLQGFDSFPTKFELVSPKEKAARAATMEIIAKSALRKIYQTNGSSSAARMAVTHVLEKNGCGTSPVESLNISSWGVSNRNKFDPNGFKISGLSSLENLQLPKGFLQFQPDFFSKMLETQAPFHELDHASVVAANDRWKNVGFGGSCHNTISAVDDICSGKVTAASIYAEEMSRHDPTVASSDSPFGTIAKGILKKVPGGPTGVLIYETTVSILSPGYEAMKEINRQKIRELEFRNSQLAQEIKAINKELDHIQNEWTPDPPTFAGQDLKQAFAEANQAQKERLEKEQKANEEHIEKLKASDPGEAGLGESFLPLGPGPTQAFLQERWFKYLEQIARQYGKCTKEEINPKAITVPQKNQWDQGQTCNFESAINDLNSLGQSNDYIWSERPTLAIGESTLEKNIAAAMSGSRPFCDSSRTGPNGEDRCKTVMDNYYRQFGFEGGQEEFCAVAGTCLEKPFGY